MSFGGLFRGREDAFGWYSKDLKLKPGKDRGKLEGNAKTVRKPVTPEMYEAHLQGKVRLGIIPVLKDGTCYWGAIDVDFYQEKGLHEDIAARIAEIGLPLVMTRSKSGGAHLWVFFSEPVSAAEVRRSLLAFCKQLKLPKEHIDIFPAQDQSKDLGNWMNLPYFGEQCHCLGSTGSEELTLDQFLAYADERVVHPQDLKHKTKNGTTGKNSGAPPCIDFAMQNKVPDGYGNNFLFHYGIYAQKAHPEDWKERVREFNDDYLEAPQSKHELSPIIRSLQTPGKYTGYLCKKVEGLFCDKKECRMRQYGVGGGGDLDNEIIIDKLEKIDGEEPIYRVTMDGKRFQCNVEQLFTYARFRTISFGAIDRFLPAVKQLEWESFMRERIKEMEIEQAAPDTQLSDRVIGLFQKWTQNPVTESLEAALSRRLAFYDGRDLLFRGGDFMVRVDQQLAKVSRSQVWAVMRDYGCMMEKRNGFSVDLWRWVGDGQKELWFVPYKGEMV